MTTEEYEMTIRPALAEFCGWEWSEEYGLWLKDETNAIDEHSIHCPDPLHNPADAWALLCAIMKAKPYSSIFWWAEHHDEWHAQYANNDCIVSDTPEAALVSAAWEIVKQTAERPSGE